MKTTVTIGSVELTGELVDVMVFLTDHKIRKTPISTRKFKKHKAKAKAAGRPRKKRKYTKRAAYWKKDAA